MPSRVEAANSKFIANQQQVQQQLGQERVCVTYPRVSFVVLSVYLAACRRSC
jgi:hypothetical protein